MSALSWVTYVIGVSVLLGAGALLLEGTLRAAGRGWRRNSRLRDARK